MATKFERKWALSGEIRIQALSLYTNYIQYLFVQPRILGDELSNEASLILPQLTLVAVVPTFVKFGQKLIEVVGPLVVVRWWCTF